MSNFLSQMQNPPPPLSRTFPFSLPPLPPPPLLLSNKSWAKHSLPPPPECDLHLKGKLRRGIRAMAME